MNISIRIDTSGALLSGKAPEVIQKKLDQAITSATLLLHREVIARTPQGVFGAQGGLIGSIQNEVIGTGTPQIKGKVFTAQKYAEVIEKGRRPGKGLPPRGSLVFWIAKKFGIGAWQAAKLEFVIRRSIGQKGFEGAHMFEKAFNENQAKIAAIFDKAEFDMVRELSE